MLVLGTEPGQGREGQALLCFPSLPRPPGASVWSQGGLGAEPAWVWSGGRGGGAQHGATDLMFPAPFPRLFPRPEGVFTFSPYSPSCSVTRRIRLVIC